MPDVISGFVAGAATDDVIDLTVFDGVFDDFADVLATAERRGHHHHQSQPETPSPGT
ncbi:MAG: hypothetical protein R3C58_11550 [Parvularculaceae bacterium]